MNSRTGVVVFSIIAVVCLLTANFVLWLNNTVYNKDNFSRLTVSVIQKSAVRDAVSAEIVTAVLKELPKDIPVPKKIIVGPARSIISGLLANPSFKPILERIAGQLDKAIISNKPVVLDTSEIKDAAKPLVEVINLQISRNINIDDLPDSIVLVKKGEIPSISGWGIFLLWLGPILGVIGVIISVLLIWLAGKENRASALKILGLALAIGSVVFIILVNLMRSPLMASIASDNARTIAGGMFNTFTAGLTNQTWILALAGLVMVGVGFLLPYIIKPSPVKQPRKRATKKAA